MVAQVGANFLDKPSDQTVDGIIPRPEYPGFAGLTAGFGPSFELRFFRYVGVELDVLYKSDRGAAEQTVTDVYTGAVTRFDIDIGHAGVHLPILFKAVWPAEYVQPLIFIGPELVFPGDASFEVKNGEKTTVGDFSAVSERYTMFAYGFGLELNLPVPTESIKLRIPLTVRGGFNPSVSDKRTERSTVVAGEPQVGGDVLVKSEEFKTSWQHSVTGNLGLALFF